LTDPAMSSIRTGGKIGFEETIRRRLSKKALRALRTKIRTFVRW
jgi:hypothetical protein